MVGDRIADEVRVALATAEDEAASPIERAEMLMEIAMGAATAAEIARSAGVRRRTLRSGHRTLSRGRTPAPRPHHRAQGDGPAGVAGSGDRVARTRPRRLPRGNSHFGRVRPSGGVGRGRDESRRRRAEPSRCASRQDHRRDFSLPARAADIHEDGVPQRNSRSCRAIWRPRSFRCPSPTSARKCARPSPCRLSRRA